MLADLDGSWTLTYGPHRREDIAPARLAELGWPTVPATVPGNVECDLVAAGALPPLEPGTNAYAALAYEGHEWWYRRAFTTRALAPDERAELVFDGLDCVAVVFVDGSEVGRAANALVPQRVDVTARIAGGGVHEVAVRLLPAVVAGGDAAADAGTFALPLNATSLRVRKAPHQWGWDIMPRLVSAGIWRSARIEAVAPTRLRACYAATLAVDAAARTARVALDVDVASARAPGALTLRARLTQDGRTLHDSARVLVEPRARIVADLAGVEPWWPRGYGAPALATWTLELVDAAGAVIDRRDETIGVRTLALRRRDADAAGPAEFRLVVNGVAIQGRGTNWVPLDALHARAPRRRDETLAMLADLACTLVRCWGGGVYEDDAFFAFCDRAGILVWQDFAMACAVYPQDDAFARAMAIEAEAVIRRLRNHASLALWCGDNECDEAHAWSGLPLDPNDHRITRGVLPAAVRAHDPYRPFLPSSPYLPAGVFAERVRAAEQHLWSRQDWDHPSYRDSTAAFVGEIGYHGCPDRRSLEAMMAPGELWPWRGSASWLAKAVTPAPGCGDFAYRLPLLAQQACNLVGEEPTALDDFVLASQLAQAEALKRFIERARIAKHRCGGLLWWNLRDGWPIVSDAVVDWYGRKKLAYAWIRAAQRPVAALVGEAVDGRHRVVVANDTREPARARVRVVDADSGAALVDAEVEVAAGANADVASLAAVDAPRLWLIELRSGDAVERNHHLAGPRPVALRDLRRWLARLDVPADVGPREAVRTSARGA